MILWELADVKADIQVKASDIGAVQIILDNSFGGKSLRKVLENVFNLN